MSRAFTREDDNENAIADIGERPVSAHRNLVTRNGLALIDRAIAELREDLAKAEAEADRERIAMCRATFATGRRGARAPNFRCPSPTARSFASA